MTIWISGTLWAPGRFRPPPFSDKRLVHLGDFSWCRMLTTLIIWANVKYCEIIQPGKSFCFFLLCSVWCGWTSETIRVEHLDPAPILHGGESSVSLQSHALPLPPEISQLTHAAHASWRFGRSQRLRRVLLGSVGTARGQEGQLLGRNMSGCSWLRGI